MEIRVASKALLCAKPNDEIVFSHKHSQKRIITRLVSVVTFPTLDEALEKNWKLAMPTNTVSKEHAKKRYLQFNGFAAATINGAQFVCMEIQYEKTEQVAKRKRSNEELGDEIDALAKKVNKNYTHHEVERIMMQHQIDELDERTLTVVHVADRTKEWFEKAVCAIEQCTQARSRKLGGNGNESPWCSDKCRKQVRRLDQNNRRWNKKKLSNSCKS